eukprot:TRINITY_DN6528_c0_g1_i10.p1 TRINITY_DN6528_c0_g1~~TRINITY_DN6528_c0_g1_i10.p1  ORF type:complete len:211 (-),score=-3.80 TRINITY_DN6528_c0_g1_i10:113-745(-)
MQLQSSFQDDLLASLSFGLIMGTLFLQDEFQRFAQQFQQQIIKHLFQQSILSKNITLVNILEYITTVQLHQQYCKVVPKIVGEKNLQHFQVLQYFMCTRYWTQVEQYLNICQIELQPYFVGGRRVYKFEYCVSCLNQFKNVRIPYPISQIFLMCLGGDVVVAFGSFGDLVVTQFMYKMNYSYDIQLQSNVLALIYVQQFFQAFNIQLDVW